MFQGYIYCPFIIIFSDVILQEKKIGVFCHRDIFNNGYTTKSINRFFTGGVFCRRDIFKKGDFILPNRSIAFFQGSF